MSKRVIAIIFLTSLVVSSPDWIQASELTKSDRNIFLLAQSLKQNRAKANYSNNQLELLNLINKTRRQQGLKALTFSSNLTTAAQNHVQDLIDNNTLGHDGSDGSSVADRVLATGYDYSSVGENVAAGREAPEQVFQQWMDSPGHRDNMLAADYSEVGIGYILDVAGTTYDHYWVLVLGQKF